MLFGLLFSLFLDGFCFAFLRSSFSRLTLTLLIVGSLIRLCVGDWKSWMVRRCKIIANHLLSSLIFCCQDALPKWMVVQAELP